MENCKTIQEYEKKFEKINELPPTKLIRYPSTIDIDLKKTNDKILEMFKTTSKFY